jgi:hypothetical protein
MLVHTNCSESSSLLIAANRLWEVHSTANEIRGRKKISLSVSLGPKHRKEKKEAERSPLSKKLIHN